MCSFFGDSAKPVCAQSHNVVMVIVMVHCMVVMCMHDSSNDTCIGSQMLPVDAHMSGCGTCRLQLLMRVVWLLALQSWTVLYSQSDSTDSTSTIICMLYLLNISAEHFSCAPQLSVTCSSVPKAKHCHQGSRWGTQSKVKYCCIAVASPNCILCEMPQQSTTCRPLQVRPRHNSAVN